MLPELTPDEFSLALDTVAATALEALAIDGPPVDALLLARALGLVVAWDANQSGRARVVRLRGLRQETSQGSIFLKPDLRQERLQWATAHEVGEVCAQQVFMALSIDPREAPANAREMVANQLAARILLPKDWFAEDARACQWDLVALKQRYGTASHELIARRMLDFGSGVIVTIFDQGRRTFRKANLPGRLPPLNPLERSAWQSAHDSAVPEDRADHRCRVRVWPVHENDWRREILRTEWLLEEASQDDAFAADARFVDVEGEWS